MAGGVTAGGAMTGGDGIAIGGGAAASGLGVATGGGAEGGGVGAAGMAAASGCGCGLGKVGPDGRPDSNSIVTGAGDGSGSGGIARRTDTGKAIPISRCNASESVTGQAIPCRCLLRTGRQLLAMRGAVSA